MSLNNVVEVVDFDNQSEYVLSFRDNCLCILFENQKPIYVDFLDSQTRKRLGTLSKKSAFCKALGLKQNQSTLIDFTAGFGKDSFLASKFFNKVIWVERNPLVYLLLQDGLRRLIESYPELVNKFDLLHCEAMDYLQSSHQIHGSVLYFDFMFDDKKSKSNKEMFFLKYITKGDPIVNISNYFSVAQKANPSRVVLKAKVLDLSLIPKQKYLGPTVNYYVF